MSETAAIVATDSLPSLVADVGGTHARFALLHGHDASDSSFDFSQHAKLRCADFDSLTAVIDAYCQSVGNPSIRHACIAIAAPVFHDRVHMTNLSWEFSCRELERQLGVQTLSVINDAAAGVLATTRVKSSELKTVKPGTAVPNGPRINLVPGTGFGVSAAIHVAGAWHPLQGEGGHICLAAREPEEFAVLQHIARAHGRATPENVLSGPGMLNLYFALAAVRGIKPELVDAAQMTGLAIAGENQLCVDALQTYCSLLGALAGDFALLFGAHGGVFLSGNILQRLGTDILAGGFNGRFSGKGNKSDDVAGIPVQLVHRDHPGLLGAAVWLSSRLSAHDAFWQGDT